MAQHIPRKQLKKDEVRETIAHGAEAVLLHRQLTTYLLIGAIMIAAAVFGWREYSQRQTTKAFASFNDAMQVFQAPVGAPAAPGMKSYPDDTKKFTEANQKFTEIASKYPHTQAGRLAKYYSALSLEKLEKYDDAKKLLQPLTSGSDTDVASMAKYELALVDERTGHGDDAIRLYQELIDKPTTLVPKAVALLGLADHYSVTNPSEAAKLYGQIKSDYPDTPMAQQADQALALLPNKS